MIAEIPGGGELHLDLQRARFERQGSQRDTLVFISEEEEGPTLSCQDLSLLKALRQVRVTGFEKSFHQHHSRRRRTLWWGVGFPALILVLIFGVLPYLLFGPLTRLAVNALPVELDQAIGTAALAQAAKDFTGGAKEITDPSLYASMQQIIDPVVRQARSTPFRFKVHLYDSSMINAAALPGGDIIVTTGLLKQASSAEEVAGVLAHEIAHVICRHSVRQLVQRLGFWLIAAALVGDLSWMSSLLLDGAGTLASLGFSRDMEREADREGLKFMVAARINPEGLLAFFRRSAASPHEMEEVALFSTHPISKERIDTVRKFAAQQKHVRFKPLPLEWPEFKKRVESL